MRSVSLDGIARKMAAEAGVAWRELSDFPGYAKGRWREDARRLIDRFLPGAILIEGPRQWNGRAENRVADVSDSDLARIAEAGRHRANRRALP